MVVVYKYPLSLTWSHEFHDSSGALVSISSAVDNQFSFFKDIPSLRAALCCPTGKQNHRKQRPYLTSRLTMVRCSSFVRYVEPQFQTARRVCLAYSHIDYFYKLIRDEREAFAPKNGRYFGSNQESQSLAVDATFPLMRLPVEIRLIIYELHFLQAGEVPEEEKNCPAGESCCAKIYNRNVPVRMLWMASKQIYQEAMPIYFRTKSFRFLEVESLLSFLRIIGPHHRQHIAKITLYLRLIDNAKVFKRIAQCPSLEHLSVVTQPYTYRRMDLMRRPAIRSLLKIRNLKSVHFEVLRHHHTVPTLEDVEDFVNTLQVLKQPYDATTLKQRAAQGFSRTRRVRTTFAKAGSRSRDERRAYRAALKDAIST